MWRELVRVLNRCETLPGNDFTLSEQCDWFKMFTEWIEYTWSKLVFSVPENKCTCLTRQFLDKSLSFCGFKIAQVAVQSPLHSRGFRNCITRVDNWKFAELGPVHHVSCSWNTDVVHWMVGLWSRNLPNGWVIYMASINGSFFSQLHGGWRIMLLTTVFCRYLWETAVGCSWYFDAVFKLCVYGKYT